MARFQNSQILLSRNKYQTCHIRLPGSDERYPAVLVGQDYFSLVRVLSDIKHILAAKAKLEWNGDRTVVTQIIQRCRRAIPNFPQSFLSEYKSTQLLASLLSEYPSQEN